MRADLPLSAAMSPESHPTPSGSALPPHASPRVRRQASWERLFVVVAVCLPVPALAATGLSIPLPSVVERLAAALVPWAEAATRHAASPVEGRIVLAPGEIRAAPAQTALTRPEPEQDGDAAAAPTKPVSTSDGVDGAPGGGSRQPKPGGGAVSTSDGGGDSSPETEGPKSDGGTKPKSDSGDEPVSGGDDEPAPIQETVETVAQTTTSVVETTVGVVEGTASNPGGTVGELLPGPGG